MLNKEVLSPVLKESIEPTVRRAAGSLFQHLGPAAEKARSPNRVFIRLIREDRICPSIEVLTPKRMNASPYNTRASTQAQPHEATCTPLQQTDLKLDAKRNWEPV